MNTQRQPQAPGVLVASFSGRVFGVEPASGQVSWEHDVDRTANAASIVVTEDRVYVGSFSALTCLRYPTGEPLWSVEPRVTSRRTTLLLAGDRLFLASSGEIECFTLDGRSLWHQGFRGKGQGDVALGFPGNVVQADSR